MLSVGSGVREDGVECAQKSRTPVIDLVSRQQNAKRSVVQLECDEAVVLEQHRYEGFYEATYMPHCVLSTIQT